MRTTMPFTAVAMLSAVLMAVLMAAPVAAEEIGVAADSIKIGTTGPFTGSVPLFGYPIARGGTFFFEEVNAAGGIHGRKIVVIEEDDQCDPSKGLAATKKLIHEHKVFMLHTTTCSNVSLAVRPEVERAKIPWVSGSTNVGIYQPNSPYIFTTVLTTDFEGALLADFALTVPNARRIAVIGHRDAWGLAKSDPTVKRLQEHHRVAPVANEAMDRGANDSTPQTLRLKQANPDVVIVVLYPKEGAIFLRDAVKYGLNAVFVGNTALEDINDLVTKAGSDVAVRNLYSMTLLRYTLDDPKMAALVEKYRARYPGVTLSPFMTWAYSGAEVIVEALRRAGRDLTREKFVKEIEGIRGFESAVFPGTLNFSPDDHRGSRTANFVRYKGGKLVNIGTRYVAAQ